MEAERTLKHGSGPDLINSYLGKDGRLRLPPDVDILGERLFENFHEIRSVALPQGLVSIESRVFSCCRNLTEILFPSSLKVIGEHAFSSTALREIVIPGSVNEIPACAFSCCSDLEEVVIRAGVSRIHDDAFACCDNLRRVYLEDTNIQIEPGAFRVSAHCLRKSQVAFYVLNGSCDQGKAEGWVLPLCSAESFRLSSDSSKGSQDAE